MKLNKLLVGVAAAAALFASTASAAVIPSGVQNDVTLSTVTNTWGWTLISQSNYGDSTSIANLFAGHGQYVMIGAMRSGSNVIDVLAADLYSTVTSYTAENATNASNGIGWYYNAYSMGFVGAGDALCQNSADTCGMNERDRLSWHTSLSPNAWNQSSAQSPLYVFNGWRSGDNTNIYTGTDWTRVVFTLNAAVVPEPGSIALLGLALAGLAASRRRKSA